MTGYQPVTVRLLARESWDTQFPIGEKVGKNWAFSADDIEKVLSRKKSISLSHQVKGDKMAKPAHLSSHIDPQVMELWQSNRSLIQRQDMVIKEMRDAIWDMRKTMAALGERMELIENK